MSMPRDLFRQPYGYQLPLEVLATVPYAAPVNLKTLAADFHLTLRQVRSLVWRLMHETGYELLIDDGTVRVSPQGRAWVEKDVNEYWARVHERPLKHKWYA
jgi:hypothetical protein